MRKREFYGTISDEYFKSIVNDSLSVAEVVKSLELPISGQNYRLVYNRIDSLKLDTSHMTGQGWNKGNRSISGLFPFDEVFCKDSKVKMHNSARKFRLIDLGLKEDKCECCGNPNNWNGKPLTLQLHHINGDHNDNRVENLQILCPNCHSQTDNFCARKKRKDLIIPEIVTVTELIRCPFCNEEVPITSNHIDKCQSKYIKMIDKRDSRFAKYVKNYEGGFIDKNGNRHSQMLGKDIYEKRKDAIFNSGIKLKRDACIK